jgi:uncharacterized protein
MDPAAVKLTHLKSADYKSMPWKNGGGTTTELMAESRGAEGYDWRLSIAAVSTSGPFSDFSGYDRTIMLVEGKGFTLDFAECAAPQPLVSSFEPFRFDGAWRTHCTLIDGPVKDFNLIARKGVHAVLEVLRLTPGVESIAAATTTVLHLFHGQLAAADRGLVAGDSLRIDGATAPIALTATRPSILAAIRIGAQG